MLGIAARGRWAAASSVEVWIDDAAAKDDPDCTRYCVLRTSASPMWGEGLSIGPEASPSQLWVREGLLGGGRPVLYCSTSEADAIQGRAAWYSTRSLQVDYCEAALTHEIPLLCQRPIGSPPQRAAYFRIIAVAAIIPLPQSSHGPSIRAAQGRAPSGWPVPDLRARDPTLPPALALQRESRLLLHRCLHSAPSVRPCHGQSPAPPSPTTRGRPVLAAKPRRDASPREWGRKREREPFL